MRGGAGSCASSMRTQAWQQFVLKLLAGSPRQTGQLLNIGQTRVWHLIGSGELESYWEGRSRKITMRSIRARHERQLAAAVTAQADLQPPRRGRSRKPPGEARG